MVPEKVVLVVVLTEIQVTSFNCQSFLTGTYCTMAAESRAGRAANIKGTFEV